MSEQPEHVCECVKRAANANEKQCHVDVAATELAARRRLTRIYNENRFVKRTSKWCSFYAQYAAAEFSLDAYRPLGLSDTELAIVQRYLHLSNLGMLRLCRYIASMIGRKGVELRGFDRGITELPIFEFPRVDQRLFALCRDLDLSATQHQGYVIVCCRRRSPSTQTPEGIVEIRAIVASATCTQ